MVSLANPPHAPSLMMALKPSLSLKRKHSDLNSDDQIPSSPPVQAKRLRVAFDDAVDIRIVPDWNEKGLDLVREEVKRALEKYAAGDSSGYDQIKQLFAARPSSDEAPSSALLSKYLSALTGHVSALGKNYSAVVHNIIDTRWLIRDDTFVSYYIKFLGSLMSAQGGYIGLVLRSVVNNFNQLPTTASKHPDDPRCSRADMLDRVHKCLKYLIRLIPSASTVLKSTISAVFPHASDSAKAHIDYIKNILRIIDYASELRGTVLALITERLVKIDVQVQTDMEDLEEDIEDELLNGTVQLTVPIEHEDDSVLSESSDSDSDSDEDESEEKRVKELKESVHKMDAILDLLFEYYAPAFGKGSDGTFDEVYENLLGQFVNTILPTYRSRHTQFLIFHFAQSSPGLIRNFTGACAYIAFDKTRPQVIRLAASAYLASFVARGAHVDRAIAQDVFQLLTGQLEILRQSYEPSCTGPDLRRYGAYYAIAQALLYLFCFRWRDLIEDEVEDEDISSREQDFTWIPEIKEVLHYNMISSKLNPLKVCSPDIVHQFARIAHHLNFMYVYSKLEANKKVRLGRTISNLAMHGSLPERQSALSGQTEESHFQLDAYFPFDPYRLPKSKRWLEGDYNEWKSVPGMDMPGQSDDEDTEREEESEVEGDYDDGTETDASV